MGSKDSISGFAIGFTLGAALGLATAFLFAPRPGRETIERLKDRATDITETARGLTADREKVYTEAWQKRKGQPRVSNSYFQ